jgi:hypothetical protein
MIVAGIETMTMTSDYSKTPDHTKNRGFEGTLSFQIELDGTINLVSGSEFYFYHGLVLGIAWSVFSFIQILSNRYLKMFPSLSSWLHRGSGFIIFLSTFIMMMLTYKYESWK